MIVADTNLIIYLYAPGLHKTIAEQIYRQEPVWAAPYLWRSEFRNALAAYLRREIITLPTAKQMMNLAQSLLWGEEYHVSAGQVLELLNASTASAYDCEYVALAQELGVPLVTADKKVLREFPDTAVSLEQFTKI